MDNDRCVNNDRCMDNDKGLFNDSCMDRDRHTFDDIGSIVSEWIVKTPFLLLYHCNQEPSLQESHTEIQNQ